jgi:long-chain acyl-CoA synthetase
MGRGKMPKNLCELFWNSIKTYPKDNLMMDKQEGKYVSTSSQEFGERVKYFSYGLYDLGVRAGDKVVIISETRSDWTMADLAISCLGGVVVPIYTTLTPPQMRYIVNDSDAKVIIFSCDEIWQKLMVVKKELTGVDHFITLEPQAPEGAVTKDQIIERGSKVASENPTLLEKSITAIKPDDLFTIMYTSGTTGPPKGVMLTHNNLISNAVAVASLLPIGPDDIAFSWLPLSHSFGRLASMLYFHVGCSVVYAESMDTLIDNMIETKPTVMPSAPRLFEKFYAVVMESVLAGSGIKKKIFFWALKVGKKHALFKIQGLPIPASLEARRKLAHKLVFSKILAKTGGNFKFCISGAAPLAKDIGEFFYAMGFPILEGYGLTETSPAITVNTFENLKFGTVGKPIPEVEVRIAEDGEILTKGPHVMNGYYKNEEATQEVLKSEWFYTGDIGYIDEDGFVVITDRKKDIIVTAGGKNVAPQPVENILKMNKYILNAVLIGDKRSYITALIVPEFEHLKKIAASKKISYENLSDLCKNEEIIAFYLKEIDSMTTDLARYEKIKKIALLDRDFEIEKEEITPTLKVKRRFVSEKYKDVIDSMYEKGEDYII